MPLCRQQSLWHEHTFVLRLTDLVLPQCLCPTQEDQLGKVNVKDEGQKEVEEEIGKQ